MGEPGRGGSQTLGRHEKSVHMRKANEAIVRELHPILKVDDILYQLNGSKVFSKLDLKWGFHQI